jgi:hypothetical protein
MTNTTTGSSTTLMPSLELAYEAVDSQRSPRQAQ